MPPDGTADGLVDRIHRAVVAGEAIDGVEARVRSEAPLLDRAAVSSVVDEVRARVTGLGPLEPFLADPSVSEVMVNPVGDVWIERHGRLRPTSARLTPGTVLQIAERVVGPLGLRVDRSSPLVDARLPDGSRVNVVLPPLAVDGPCLTIRRFVVHEVDLDDVSPPGVGPLLRWAVGARANLVVCGGSGSGKTTLLNALAGEIPPGERVVTIEDTAELQLPGDHVVRLESRPATAEGVGEVTVRRLLRNALRMRPDRIIVGEVRGPEAVEMVHAMTTGHDGSLSSCHANGPADALRRLETMALMADLGLSLPAVRDHLASAVDLVVHVARRPDGRRVVAAVDEVLPTGQDEDPRTRPLVGPRGLMRLPERGLRGADAPPCSPGWLAT